MNVRLGRKLGLSVVTATVLSLALAACGSDSNGGGTTPASPAVTADAGTGAPPDTGDASGESSALDALIAAAQAEGTLTLYGSPGGNTLETIGNDFTEKYGITVQSVRLTSSDLTARFTSEVESQAPTADVLLVGNSTFVRTQIDAGSLVDLAAADIPDYPVDMPEEWLRPEIGSAVVLMQPAGVAWNTDLVTENPPQSFADLIDPRWAGGNMGVPDAEGSESYLNSWYAIGQALNPDDPLEFARNIGDLEPKFYASGAPTMAALAAGEVMVAPFVLSTHYGDAKAQGAHVEMFIPPLSTGPIVLATINANAASPNAARLFVHYLLTTEGNQALNVASGEPTPLSASRQEGFIDFGSITEDARASADDIVAGLRNED